MSPFTEAIGRRLAQLGMPLEGERLVSAVRIVEAHSDRPHELTDLLLMTICVEAYRQQDLDLPAWV